MNSMRALSIPGCNSARLRPGCAHPGPRLPDRRRRLQDHGRRWLDLQIGGECKTFRTGTGSRKGRVAALDDVSLAVGDGEIVASVGESGSGKSTLGRAVVGLERLDAGELVFDGVEYARMAERPLRHLRRRMHLVLAPLFFYPYSKTLWVAIELTLRPIDEADPSDVRLDRFTHRSVEGAPR